MANRVGSVVFLVFAMLSMVATSFRVTAGRRPQIASNRLLINSNKNRAMTMKAGEVQRMTVTQFGDILKGDSRSLYQIIDVREVDELAVASIKGADIINLPLGSAAEWSPKVEQGKLLDASKPTICLCKVGMRSMRVATFFASQGFEEVYNVDGGINGYANKVDPTIPMY
jgi:rhodanese-related sulfurtransferase